MKKIKVIGAGGIGSLLLPTLCRFLDVEDDKSAVTIIDGKSYSNKNRSRQLFSRLGNKAQVSVEMLASEFKNINFQARSEYITDTSALYLLEDGDIIFSCVDNHKTRLLVSTFCEQELDDVVVISGGNDYFDGNVQIFVRKNGKNLTLPIANKFHPEIVNPKDKRPDEIGCDEAVISGPQLIFTNNMVAATMLNAFYKQFYVEKSHYSYNEVYVDIISNNARSLTRS